MDWMEREEMDAEFGAKYDYVREAFGSTALDLMDNEEPAPARPLAQTRADYRGFRETWMRLSGGSAKVFEIECRKYVQKWSRLPGYNPNKSKEEVGETWALAASMVSGTLEGKFNF